MAGRYRCDHTLFIEDLETAKGFYDEVFGLLVVTRTRIRRCSDSAKRSSICYERLRRRALSHPRRSPLGMLVFATISRSASRT
jgi:catechol 2,3-dioxygenase-like lactoylglutathione lyase family enzyme